jgi:hypothetical protein
MKNREFVKFHIQHIKKKQFWYLLLNFIFYTLKKEMKFDSSITENAKKKIFKSYIKRNLLGIFCNQILTE